jgi:hypothetical protein
LEIFSPLLTLLLRPSLPLLGEKKPSIDRPSNEISMIFLQIEGREREKKDQKKEKRKRRDERREM